MQTCRGDGLEGKQLPLQDGCNLLPHFDLTCKFFWVLQRLLAYDCQSYDSRKGRGTRGTRSGLAEFGEHHVTELRAVVTPK